MLADRDGHRNCIARALHIVHPNLDCASGGDSARNPRIDLVQSWKTWRIAEPENLCHSPTDRHLRRDGATIGETGAVDDHNLSGHRGILIRHRLIRRRVLDRPFAVLDTGERQQLWRRFHRLRMVNLGAGNRSTAARISTCKSARFHRGEA